MERMTLGESLCALAWGPSCNLAAATKICATLASDQVGVCLYMKMGTVKYVSEARRTAYSHSSTADLMSVAAYPVRGEKNTNPGLLAGVPARAIFRGSLGKRVHGAVRSALS